MSKERPFTPRAQELERILAGRQTQFRRLMQPQPDTTRWKQEVFDKPKEWRLLPTLGPAHPADDKTWGLYNITDSAGAVPYTTRKYPFGFQGSTLWIKEKWLLDCPYGPPESCDNPDHVYHFQGEPAQDSFPMPWRSAITMPRWASRLTLRVLKVGVERVQDIDEIGAQKEGWFYQGHNLHHAYDPVTMDTARRWFIEQWNAAYASRGFAFEDNPHVWVVEFELVPQGYNKDAE